MDWKSKHSKAVSSPQIDMQLYIPYQNPSKMFLKMSTKSEAYYVKAKELD